MAEITSNRIDQVFKKIKHENKHGAISLDAFMKTIENIIMELSPKETKRFEVQLDHAQHKPGGAVDPPIPKNVQKFYDRAKIHYEDQKGLYYHGHATKRSNGGKLVTYKDLPYMAEVGRSFISDQFGK
ncbi:MAG: hypothetical protein AJITA_00809 [Acetilactobacillus jinshanensis]